MIWNGLPMIRREIAESMINNFGLTQKEAAEKLGVTPAAICQYLSKKRGNTIEISNETIREEIRGTIGSLTPTSTTSPTTTTTSTTSPSPTTSTTTSSFLTFDGKYDNKSRHFFDGNLD